MFCKRIISIFCTILSSLPLYSMDNMARKTPFVFDTTQQIPHRQNQPGSIFQSTYKPPSMQGLTPLFQDVNRQYSLQHLVNQAKECKITRFLNSLKPKIQNLSRLRTECHTFYSSASQNNIITRNFPSHLGRLKQFRRIATRFEKIKANVEALIYLACSYLRLI